MPTTKTSKLPADPRGLRMDPDLAAFLEGQLAPHSGKKLEAAQRAVLKVRHSGFSGSWDELKAAYTGAITKAVT